MEQNGVVWNFSMEFGKAPVTTAHVFTELLNGRFYAYCAIYISVLAEKQLYETCARTLKEFGLVEIND